jgi:hypothetical protein
MSWMRPRCSGSAEKPLAQMREHPEKLTAAVGSGLPFIEGRRRGDAVLAEPVRPVEARGVGAPLLCLLLIIAAGAAAAARWAVPADVALAASD